MESISAYGNKAVRKGDSTFKIKRIVESIIANRSYAIFNHKRFKAISILSPWCSCGTITATVILHCAGSGNCKNAVASDHPFKVCSIAFAAAIAGSNYVRIPLFRNISVPFSVNNFPGAVPGRIINSISINIERRATFRSSCNYRNIAFKIIFIYSAVIKSTPSYGCHTLRDYKFTCKTGAILESIVPNCSYTIRHYKISIKTGTAMESPTFYHRYSIRYN